MVTVLKLGGSVITDKGSDNTVADDHLERIASHLSAAQPDELVLVLGGGSFGHPAARRHGVSATEGTFDGAAIADIHTAMTTLTDRVLTHLSDHDIQAVPMHPLSLAYRDGDGLQLELGAVSGALRDGFVPVLHGDGVVTAGAGVTILSGDDIVVETARILDADRVGLCSDVDGVLDASGAVIEEIDSYETVIDALGRSETTDVTGGMARKVRVLLELSTPANVFGIDALSAFLAGESPGTTVLGEGPS